MHRMKLQAEPYNKIKSGHKDIELRLYDEKRQNIKKGDYIIFKNNETGEKLVAQCLSLHKAKTFAELFKMLDDNERMGFGKDMSPKKMSEEMRKYYSYENEHKYGVVGIEIKVLIKEGGEANVHTSALCRYKGEEILFAEGNTKYDGEYVFVPNNTEDFSLYNPEAFHSFQNTLLEVKYRTGDKSIALMAAYILRNAEFVTVTDGAFRVPVGEWSNVCSEEFELQVYSDHIRVISLVKQEERGTPKDVVELTMEAFIK